MAEDPDIIEVSETAIIPGSKMTPALVDIFCRLVAMGNYYRAVCNAVGITYETFNIWMRLGRVNSDPTNPYRQFYDKVMEANARAEVFAVQQWRNHFEHDYRAARDFLARRFPDRWASRHYVSLAVDREVEKILGNLRNVLPPDQYLNVVRAMAGQALTADEDVIDTDTLVDEETAFNLDPMLPDSNG